MTAELMSAIALWCGKPATVEAYKELTHLEARECKAKITQCLRDKRGGLRPDQVEVTIKDDCYSVVRPPAAKPK